MTVIDEQVMGRKAELQTIEVNHFIRGKLVRGDAVRHTSRDLGVDFTTPAIDLDALITPRSEMPPLFDMKLSDIIDFLVEVGERLDPGRNVLSPGIAGIRRGHQPAAPTDHRESVSSRAAFLDSRCADGELECELS